jgi:hypothetical protein
MRSSDKLLANVLFEYHDADVILRSHDSYHFRVSKSYIINSTSSSELKELFHESPNPPNENAVDALSKTSLPVVQLPESGETLHCLLTFVFPVTTILPSTTEQIMELLSVAQKYQMVSVLAHIRLSIAQEKPLATQRDTAFIVYSLAQKYELREEALKAATTIAKYPMNIENLEDKLNMMSGVSLYELWKYHKQSRAILALDLTKFRTSSARDMLAGLHCAVSTSSDSHIPGWLDVYIRFIEEASSLVDVIDPSAALMHHITYGSSKKRCACRQLLHDQTSMRDFRKALGSVISGSFAKVSVIAVTRFIMRLKSL